MTKLLPKIVLGFFLGLLVALIVAWLSLDRILQAGIEQNVTATLGAPTHIEKLRLRLFEGQLDIDGLTIGNSSGFTSPYLVRMNHFDIKLNPASLLGETIEIQKFDVDGLDVNIEQNFAKNNVLAAIEKLNQGKIASDRKQPEAEKKVKVDRVQLSNIVANLKISVFGRAIDAKVFNLHNLEVTDIRSDNAGGIAISELIRKILLDTFTAIVEQAKGALPK